MCLSPEWEGVLRSSGFDAVHWSAVGRGNAPDSEILSWARVQGFVLFTHDLDFGTLLAHSHDRKPSVIQLRSQEVTPAESGELVVSVLNEFSDEIEQGALVTVDPQKTRARILPL